MEKKGLVTRAIDMDKKNRWRVGLTEKGQDAYRQSLKRESIHTVMSSLSEDERQRLESCLRKVRDQALKHGVAVPIIPFP